MEGCPLVSDYKMLSVASSRNSTSHKKNDQEEEILMNSGTFVNEAYNERVPRSLFEKNIL